ncbi:SDR family oxidoreductase [Aeromicrobium sp. UC242_57]|uniref:SDR family oxidoreductase n=1 Tax=Aeromicrobium sp. UC242_57 TaxID=3374624 RepID=UPI0037B68C18
MPANQKSPDVPRSAVVTGAGRGIGRAVAAELVARGYRVVVTDLDEAAAVRAADEIGASEGLRLDVTDPEANRVVAVHAREIAPLAVWVCNAGVLFEGEVTSLTEQQIRTTFDVNVLGAVWGVRAAADAFREQSSLGIIGGQIGVLASLSAHAPVPGLSVYAASKAAVLSLVTSLVAGSVVTTSTCTRCAPTGSTPRWWSRWCPRGVPARSWRPESCSARRTSLESSSTCWGPGARSRRCRCGVESSVVLPRWPPGRRAGRSRAPTGGSEPAAQSPQAAPSGPRRDRGVEADG